MTIPAEQSGQAPCKRCGGTGDVEVYDYTRGPEGDRSEATCPECGGTGIAPQSGAKVKK